VITALLLSAARRPVARIGRSAGAEPGRAFLLGLAAEIFLLPALAAASVALMITIVGIPLLLLMWPLAMIGVLLALLLGFTAVVCRIGEVMEDRFGWRANSAMLATAIGLVLVLGPTVLARVLTLAPEPLRGGAFALLAGGVILEYIVWTIGLGAALMTGLGRWSTAPPAVPPIARAEVLPVG
jgi:hypothetical protein